MKFDYIENNKERISKALFVVSVVLGILMFFKIGAFAVTSARLGSDVESAIAKNKHDDEAVKKCLAKYTDAANELKKKNLLPPPPPKPTPPKCTGILGDIALINGKGHKVGEEVAGARIVAIGPKEVTILWEEKEMALRPFAEMNFSSPPSPAKAAPKKTDKPAPVVAPTKPPENERQEPPGPGRRRGRMSREDRQKLRNMSREERREYIREQREERNAESNR